MAAQMIWQDGLTVLHVGGLMIQKGDTVPDGIFSDSQVAVFRKKGFIPDLSAPAQPSSQPEKGSAK